MTEAAIVRRLLKAVNRLECGKAIKIHGSRYVEAGTPDIFAVVSTVPFVLEVKRPQQRATKIQKFRLYTWATAGAVAAVVCSAEEGLDIIARALYDSDKQDANRTDSGRGMRCRRCDSAAQCVVYARRSGCVESEGSDS